MKRLFFLLTIIFFGSSCTHSVLQVTKKTEPLQRKISSDGADQIESHSFEAKAGKFKSHISWTYSETPSKTFAEALRRFTEFYSPKNP